MSESSAEASALHAVLDGDMATARRVLEAFLPGELRTLEAACGELGALCSSVRQHPPEPPDLESPILARTIRDLADADEGDD